ncbi:MAG: DUF362 domain-containing protein [bacterium]|nr:DUF362 domain-containing protein [bacterium]MDD5756305.1 DUF362 domain-containing protein [bacterium]
MFKVAAIQCKTYKKSEVSQALNDLLAHIGGLGAYVKPGQKVLIKPNLLAPRPPETAVTTHPALIAAIAEAIKQQGALPFIGDSPGGFGVLERIEQLWEITGMKQAAAASGATLVNFEKSRFKELELSLGKKRIKIPIAACVVEDFDVVINVPKFKTHDLTVTTGAIKNMFGVMPGLTKIQFHKFAPKKEDLSTLLVALFTHVVPQLNIMDGIIGMEGEGPGSSGTPISTGFLLAADNALAMDMVQASIMGIPLDRVPIIVSGIKAGLGPKAMAEIKQLGPSLEELQPKKFSWPPGSYTDKIPMFLIPLLSYIARLVRLTNPVVNDKLCTRCQICVKSCPVKAIDNNQGKIRVNYKVCIECFCCIELCPARAMTIKKSRLLRLAEKKG